jgi:release factor glutamine methyltransferase
MNEQAWTIGRLLSWTAEFFTEKQIDQPRLAAEVLLAHVLSCRRIELYTRFEEVVDEGPRSDFRGLIKRHASGEPVAYLVGYREFYSLAFSVNSHVLIPRPETEVLVSETLDRLPAQGQASAWKICDVGTGSGIVAISLAKYLPTAQITAVDISPAALEVAQKNAHRHGVDQRITFVQGDLLSQLPGQVFDAIVSNPPYVSEAELAQVAKSVKEFEPRGALIGGGADGGQTTRDLIDQARTCVKPGGWLLFETSPMLATTLKGYLESQPAWAQCGVVKDSAGLPRVVWARKQSS